MCSRTLHKGGDITRAFFVVLSALDKFLIMSGSILQRSSSMFENIVEEVPDYKTFFTVDELNASSEKLAHKHPSRAR